MKRKFKRIASLVLAAVMVFAMAVPAMAESVAQSKSDSLTLTVNDPEKSHKYTAYQIFKGDVLVKGDPAKGVTPGDKTFSNAEWGDVATDEVKVALQKAFETELNALDKDVYPEGSAAAMLKAIANSTKSDTEKVNAIIKSVIENKKETLGISLTEGEGKYTATVTPGYYLIVDESTTEGDEALGEGDVSSSYVVEVVGDTSVSPKKEKPSSGKEVKDINDSKDAAAGKWQKSADYDIGDAVPFRLRGKVAKDYQSYTNGYKFVFHDTQSAGLDMPTFKDIKVYVGESFESATTTFEDAGEGTATGAKYRIVKDPDDDCTFEIIFDNLSSVDNLAEKEIIIEYTSVLNNKANIGKEGNLNTLQLEYSSNPEGKGTNKTPKEETVVFTYELDVDKVDEAGETLTGAVFTLYKWMLGAAPEGYETDEHTPTTQPGGVKLTKPGDPGYWKALSAKEVTGTTTRFEFEGLDDGIYKLVETTTPAGRNTAPDIDFEIRATHDEGAENKQELKEFNITPGAPLTSGGTTGATANKTKEEETETVAPGFVYGEVINREGTTLPETGGIGTTIFYVVGSVLVLGAVILLVTKRRMKAD